MAALQLELLLAEPYTLASDDLLFAVHPKRSDIYAMEMDAERTRLEAKPKACLRASPLVKTQGWVLHHDSLDQVAAIAIEDPADARHAADPALKVVAGMQ